MCGIAGLASSDSFVQVDLALIQRMCNTIVHRGPDGDGYFVADGLAMGMRRLAIIDVAGGDQPITNEDGSVVTVFNGEIYNYRELRAELVALGHHFRTRSDTEVIVHGYEEWGIEFLNRLNGMFAIALFDIRARRLLLARDHVGIKPLYYAWNGRTLVWGSEIKALLASGNVDRSLDFDALAQFVAWEYCPAPQTLFAGINKLLPGRWLQLEIDTNTIKSDAYWSVPAADNTGLRSDDDWIDAVDSVLRQAVRRQMVSDVPLGAFLSGGVDSSLISAAMGNPTTFSIGFKDASYNELAYSSQVAKHLDVEHITEVLDDDCVSLFGDLLEFMDDPIGDSSIFPTYLLSRLARRHVTVALSGDGGDELFAGYETYAADRVARRYLMLPRMVRQRLVEPLARQIRPTASKKGLVNKGLRFIEGMVQSQDVGHARWRVFLNETTRRTLFTADAVAAMRTPVDQHIVALYSDAAGRSRLDQALFVDLYSFLPDDILTKVDRMSMAVSLEARVPFLDKEVIELAFRVPDRLKIRNGQTKWILKQVAERYLPKNVVYRPKEGFSAPVKHWIATTHRTLVEELLDPTVLKADGIFRPETVSRLIEEHVTGRRNHSHQLWCLLMFQAWKRRWLEGPLC
jgi:asparagine synthase (glutamine-hydrolysing)